MNQKSAKLLLDKLIFKASTFLVTIECHPDYKSGWQTNFSGQLEFDEIASQVEQETHHYELNVTTSRN